MVLTTCYPSDEEDPSGIFIAKLVSAIKTRGYEPKVVAPSNGIFHGRRVLDGIETVRFGYFWPRSMERLTVGAGGIPENMAKSRLARLQVFPMMLVYLLVALFESRGADLIYANWLGAGIIGAIINLLTGKPLIVSYRGDDGYLARDRFLWRVLTRWVTGRSDVVAPVSREIMEILAGLGAPPAKCHLPRFGVDAEMFHPSSSRSERGEEVRLLYVGAVILKKGLKCLVEALADHSLKNVRLVVVGNGCYLGELESLCQRLGLSGRTEFKGQLPPREVAKEMRNADLLCLPSFTEGSPNVIKEAMASGLPVVASRVGGIPEIVREGVTGLLFSPGDVGELRGCIATVAGDPSLRMAMGAEGREVVIRSGISWDSTAEEFDMMFANVLAARAGAYARALSEN